jgi:hypothetical protein
MNIEIRRRKLDEIIQSEIPYMTGIRIRYKGENKEFNAYKIPLDYLIYNKNNGRIGSLVKSYEKECHPLDPENSEHASVIERFLDIASEERNDTTKSSLVRDGQKQYGIVTNDGVIIDGNRRAMLLNQIYRARASYEEKSVNVDHAAFFIGVILPQGADPKEISRLETTYQMGEDEKLDYNPIEKYLKCKDLLEFFDVSDIAEMMGEKKNTIENWLSIMQLMDDYLKYLGYDGIYTRLEKREGQFVDLERYLSTYKKGTTKVEWPYNDADIVDLTSVCFDYIRAQYEGKEFRIIAQPNGERSLFCKKNVWDHFLDSHSTTVEPINETEKSVDHYRQENQGEDISKLLAARDNDWKEKVKNHLKGNLAKAETENRLVNDANEPSKLINMAIQALTSINTDARSFYSSNVESLLAEVNKIAWDYRQMIKHKSR